MENNSANMIDKIVGVALALYIISTTAFEGSDKLSIISTITLYLFIATGTLYVLIKGRLKLNYYFVSRYLFGMVLMAAFFLNNSSIAMQTLYWYFTCVIVTVLVINFLDNENKINFTLQAYVWAGLILCLVAFNYYGLGIFRQAALSQYGVRFGSELGNENALGLASAFSIAISLYFLVFRKSTKQHNLLYIVSIVVCFPFALLTGSKKALLLILFSIALLFFLKEGKRNPLVGRFKYVLAGIVLLLVVYQIVRSVDAFWFIGERMEQMYKTFLGYRVSATDQLRLHMIEQGLSAFSQHPILGNGVAFSYVLFNTYSHNNFIEILISTGIIGFITYYSATIISFKRLVIDCKNKVGLCKLMLIVLVSISLLEWGMVSFYSRYFQILLAIVSAYASINIEVS